MHTEPRDKRNYRYERKFLVSAYSSREIEQMLKFHPACFREAFHERWINNIYFDTLGFNNYYDNVEGERDRWKARIRWYGEMFGQISKPVLEFKIKNGLLGTKESYVLAPFTMDNSFTKRTISQLIGNSKMPQHVADLLGSLEPTLLNRYRRKYFFSADKAFRVTLDTDLTYYSISGASNLFLCKVKDHSNVVVEVKYNSTDDEAVDTISSHFPFMLTKSSKYLQGLEKVLM